jgi:hypothetical protein
MNDNFETKKKQNKRGGIVAGAILVTIGILNLVTNLVKADLVMFLVFGIGLIFLVAGIAARSRGLLIPGGVVSGVGAAIVVMEKYGFALSENGKGGLFLLVFSLGWLLISVMSLVIPEEDGSRNFMWWPLIPGGIIASTGAMILQGEAGLKILAFVGQGWPVVLIGIGLYLLLRRKELKEE